MRLAELYEQNLITPGMATMSARENSFPNAIDLIEIVDRGELLEITAYCDTASIFVGNSTCGWWVKLEEGGALVQLFPPNHAVEDVKDSLDRLLNSRMPSPVVEQ